MTGRLPAAVWVIAACAWMIAVASVLAARLWSPDAMSVRTATVLFLWLGWLGLAGLLLHGSRRRPRIGAAYIPPERAPHRFYTAFRPFLGCRPHRAAGTTRCRRT